MDALKQRLSSDFVPEWCAVGALVLLAMVWTGLGPVTFTAKTNDFVFLALGPCAMLVLRALTFRKGGLIAEHFSLMLLATTTICVLAYLSLASAGPLVDSRLMAMDRALGFDWLANHHFVDAHPVLRQVLKFAYGSPIAQCVYFSVFLGLLGNKDRLRDMFWLFVCGGLLTCLGGMLLPALGPSKYYGLDAGFVGVMEHLLSGRDLTFSLSGMTGVVSFPSFHTTMALMFIWGFRGTGPAGWLMTGLNVAMLCAVPYFGAHYLTDMIAGAAVMPLSLAVVRGVPALRQFRPASTAVAAAAPA